ncbi:MAG: hypothetical protein CR988_02070 [Treponema sp.]|nr:MAG: hypothetical protein CR988_02070 [Treponema sp.]
MRDLRPLTAIHLAPYMQLATALIGKPREAGGNMFRHQVDTMGILVDYGYTDSILLKASLIHDLIEDIEDFNVNEILNIDSESGEVYKLVLEVTKQKGQIKSDYLKGIIKHGSDKAKILKCADRISNMISLGFVNDPAFIDRYCDETELYIFPIAIDVDFSMYEELLYLVMSRRKYLTDSGYLVPATENIAFR